MSLIKQANIRFSLGVCFLISLAILIPFFTGPLYAQPTSPLLTPEGYWKTIDDNSGEVRSIVKIWVAEDGTLKGRIEKIFPKPNEDPDPLCEKCEGDKKNKRVLGMEFMWAFTGSGGNWRDGKILDPENGKVYHCQLEVLENGRKLKVFGYIRIIFKIGRSQTWLRCEGEI